MICKCYMAWSREEQKQEADVFDWLILFRYKNVHVQYKVKQYKYSVKGYTWH